MPGTGSTSAFAIVTGGFDGTANMNTVWANNLNQDGTVGNTTNTTWTTITTSPLPTTLAHHAMAEADDTNSLVAVGKRYAYVIGGQVNSTDAPGGTNTVYVASVDSTSGTVGPWTASTNTLPSSQAPNANVYNAAGFTSPLFAPTTNGPRFLILGGQALTGTSGPGGALSSTVYYNTLP